MCNVIHFETYDFELSPNIAEATESICCAKSEGCSWSQWSNQMFEESSPKLQEPQRSGKVK